MASLFVSWLVFLCFVYLLLLLYGCQYLCSRLKRLDRLRNDLLSMQPTFYRRMQPTYGRMQDAYRRMQPAYDGIQGAYDGMHVALCRLYYAGCIPSYAGCVQAACRLRASLVGRRLYVSSVTLNLTHSLT